MQLSPGVHVTPTVRLVAPLGYGGMGSVWTAEQTELGKLVAVKFLALDRVRQAESVARFSREAAAASQVKSPHVVQMHDYGITPDGQPFIVMELLDGRDLAVEMERRGRLTPAEVIKIVTQLAKALRRAHDRDIVHRDIKPENIFLLDDEDTFVKLLDFGIAKYSKGNLPGLATRTGSVMGTPYYMSPEQIMGSKSVDARADLWSVGVVAYQALTGRRPFGGETVGALAIAINEARPTPPSQVNPALPAAVDEWMAKACARSPNGRFSSAVELAEALRLALRPSSEPSRADSAQSSGSANGTPNDDLTPALIVAPPPSVKPVEATPDDSLSDELDTVTRQHDLAQLYAGPLSKGPRLEILTAAVPEPPVESSRTNTPPGTPEILQMPEQAARAAIPLLSVTNAPGMIEAAPNSGPRLLRPQKAQELRVRRVIVVEDSLTIRKLVELTVRGLGIQVEFASSGAEGLALLQNKAPDVLLLGFHLPDMKGYELLEKLEASQARGRAAKVVVMTAKSSEVYTHFTPFPRVRKLLQKPFKPQELLDALQLATASEPSNVSSPNVDSPSVNSPSVNSSSNPSEDGRVTSRTGPLSASRERASALLAEIFEPRFSNIPQLTEKIGTDSPARYFAKRILTSDLMEKVLTNLYWVFRDGLVLERSASQHPSPLTILQGRTGDAEPLSWIREVILGQSHTSYRATS